MDTLICLPSEIQSLLSEFLSANDTISLSQTCQALRNSYNPISFRRCLVRLRRPANLHREYATTDPRCRLIGLDMAQAPENYASWFFPRTVESLLLPIELRHNGIQRTNARLFTNFPKLKRVFYYSLSDSERNSIAYYENAPPIYQNVTEYYENYLPSLSPLKTATTQAPLNLDDNAPASSASSSSSLTSTNNNIDFYGFGVIDSDGNIATCDDFVGITNYEGSIRLSQQALYGSVPRGNNVQLALKVNSMQVLSAFCELQFVSSLDLHIRQNSYTSHDYMYSGSLSEMDFLHRYNFGALVNLQKFALHGFLHDPGVAFYKRLYGQLGALVKLEHVSITHFMCRDGTFALTENLSKKPQTLKSLSVTLQPPTNLRVLIMKMSHQYSLADQVTLSQITHLCINVPPQYGALGVKWLFDVYSFPRLGGVELDVSQPQCVMQETEALAASKQYRASTPSSYSSRASNYAGLDGSALSSSTLIDQGILSSLRRDTASPSSESSSADSLSSFSSNTDVSRHSLRERWVRSLDLFNMRIPLSTVVNASNRILDSIRNVEYLSCLPSFLSSSLSFGYQYSFSNLKCLVLDSFEQFVTENKETFSSAMDEVRENFDHTVTSFMATLLSDPSLLNMVYSLISQILCTFYVTSFELIPQLVAIKKKLLKVAPEAKHWNIPLDRLLGLLVPSSVSATAKLEGHPTKAYFPSTKSLYCNDYFSYYPPQQSSGEGETPLYAGVLYVYKHMDNVYEAILRLMPNLERLEIQSTYNAMISPRLSYLVHKHSALKTVLISQYVSLPVNPPATGSVPPSTRCLAPFQDYVHEVVIPGSPGSSYVIDAEALRNGYSRELARLERRNGLRYDGLKTRDQATETDLLQRREHSDPWAAASLGGYTNLRRKDNDDADKETADNERYSDHCWYAKKFTFGVSGV